MIGEILRGTINAWVATTGTTCRYDKHPWLKGPMGEGAVIGNRFYETFAATAGLTVEKTEDGGLLDDFQKTMPAGISKNDYQASIADFYEHTVRYKLEVWSQWYGGMRFFAHTLIRTLSRKMNQLNIPLEPLETSRGMSSEVFHLKDENGVVQYACWLRQTVRSGKVVYAGFYSHCIIEGKPYVKVVFPLPDGNATVVLRAEVLPDRSFRLVTDGKRIGESGYYRVRRHTADSVKVKFVPLKETIHVYEDEDGILRTDHIFGFLRMKMLHLHYKILPAAKKQ